MMTITEIVKEKQEKIKNKRINEVYKYVMYFLFGLAFGCGNVLASLHPFGVSIIAASKKKYIPFSTAGAVIGALIQGLDAYSVRYSAAAFAACLCAYGISALNLNSKPAAVMAGAFSSSFITGLVLNLNVGENLSGYLLTLGESILSAGGAYFFYNAVYSNYKRLRFRALPMTEVTCIVIFISILVMNLSEIKMFRFTPARIAAVALTLTALRFLGERWGVILALSFGFALSLADSDRLFIVGAFAFSVTAAALFSGLSHIWSGIAFVCSVSFFCIASESAHAFDLFVDSGAGTLIFLLLPPKLTYKLEELCSAGLDAPSDGTLRQSLVLKLRFAGAAMAAISESVEQVSERIDEISRKENIKDREKIGEAEYASREIILEKTNQIRHVASDQFFSISDMLEDLAFEFDEAEIFDSSASAKIRRLLGEYEIYPQSISVVEDKYSRMRVEILTDSSGSQLSNPSLKNEIGKICSRYFENGMITNFKEETMLSFYEKPNYKLSVGFAQHSADGSLCGDTVKIINDNKGHSILIISDGMGKGSRAALDGAMGAGLLSKLINAGFGFDSALKVVNSALLVKSNDESLATLDIANIDLFTGKCEILKAGAPASYILKGKSVNKCELFSMPAGILRGIEFAKRTAVLSPDDYIVLMSDGISDLGEEWLNKTLGGIVEKAAQEAADYILDKALSSSDLNKLDDMSVIVAILERN